jgi:hypothetical protein
MGSISITRSNLVIYAGVLQACLGMSPRVAIL